MLIAHGLCPAFVTGTTRSEQRGCYSSDRPPLDMLVGYEYDCNAATCYCLYEQGTLDHGTYSRCFDSMNTGPIGSGLPVQTRNVGSASRACYRVHTQPMDICTRDEDFTCYVDGRPKCCAADSPYQCPSFMTECDNTGYAMGGGSVCTDSPDLECWPSTYGQPPCCSEPGGAVYNCPQRADLKVYQPCEPPQPTRTTKNPTRRPTR